MTDVQVKPLIWEDLGDGKAFRAQAPLFGSIRVENWGGNSVVLWSVPGFCDTFTDGVFKTPEDAKAAAQADYEARISSVLVSAPAAPDYVAKLRAALRDALAWIDAVPSGTPLPTMPGFDRDAVDALLDAHTAEQPAPAQRCAECDCKHGGRCCTWIKSDGPCEQCHPQPAPDAVAEADKLADQIEHALKYNAKMVDVLNLLAKAGLTLRAFAKGPSA